MTNKKNRKIIVFNGFAILFYFLQNMQKHFSVFDTND